MTFENPKTEHRGAYLTKNFRRRVEVDEPLVDAELIEVPGLGTFTVGRLTGVQTKSLCREPNWAFDVNLLRLCPLDEIAAHCDGYTQ